MDLHALRNVGSHCPNAGTTTVQKWAMTTGVLPLRVWVTMAAVDYHYQNDACNGESPL